MDVAMAAIRMSSEMLMKKLADCVFGISQKVVMIERINDPSVIIHMPFVNEKTRMDYIVFLG